MKIKKFNETYIQIEADPDVYHGLSDHFQFEVPGAKWTPKVRAGVWDGKIRLFNMQKRTIYAGLFERVKEFAHSINEKAELIDSPAFGLPGQEENIHLDDVKDYVDSLNIHSKKQKIEAREYQLAAIHSALKDKRKTILSPTGSGKSLIIYSLARYISENYGRVLIIVPTVQLVHQMIGDFKDYASEIEWDAEETCHLIMSGHEKNSKKDIVISTWQSLQHMESPYFNQFTGGMIVDEVHSAAAMALTKIMEKATNVQYRIGLTGTLSKAKSNEMVIIGLFGEVTKVAHTKQLMDEGHLSEINIKCLVLKYGSETKSLFASKKIDYQKEIDFIVSHDRRNKFIRNLALSIEGNTLILFNYVEKHGKILYDLIKEKAGGRPVHFVHGGIEAEDRDEVRKLTEESNNTIILASYGVFQVGVNIKKLHNIITAAPTKSVIRVLQSIGRGLRTHDSKEHLNLYDIVDAMNISKSHRNHAYKHAIERLAIYAEQNWEYKIVEVNIE